MELTGKQKVQLLVSILEDNSSEVLKHLSESSASKLSDSLDDAPDLEDEEMGVFLKEVVDLIEFKRSSQEEPEDILDIDTQQDDLGLELDDASDDFSDDLSLGEVEETEPETESVFPDNYRAIEHIAEELMKQQDQLIAFFFEYVDEELGIAIKEYVPEDAMARIENSVVEKNPMSEKIYKKLFDLIVIKSEEELQEEADTEGEDESASASDELGL